MQNPEFYATISWYEPVCWNWQTRRTQNPLLATACGFESHHRHHQKAPESLRIRAFAFLKVPTEVPTFIQTTFCTAQRCRPVVSVGTRHERVFPPHKGEGVALRSRYGFRSRSFGSQSPLGHAVRCEVSPSAAALLHCCTWRLVSSRKSTSI